jgi:hypothetical protein
LAALENEPAWVRPEERLEGVDPEQVLDREQVLEPGTVAALDAMPSSLIQASPPCGLPLRQGVGLAQIAYARTDMPKRLGKEIGSEGSVRQLIHNQIVILARHRCFP